MTIPFSSSSFNFVSMFGIFWNSIVRREISVPRILVRSTGLLSFTRTCTTDLTKLNTNKVLTNTTRPALVCNCPRSPANSQRSQKEADLPNSSNIMRFFGGSACWFEYVGGEAVSVKLGTVPKLPSGKVIMKRSRRLFDSRSDRVLDPSVEFLMMAQSRCNASHRELRKWGMSPSQVTYHLAALNGRQKEGYTCHGWRGWCFWVFSGGRIRRRREGSGRGLKRGRSRLETWGWSGGALAPWAPEQWHRWTGLMRGGRPQMEGCPRRAQESKPEFAWLKYREHRLVT